MNLFVNMAIEGSYNPLSTILFLMNDYFEFGIYNSQNQIFEVNGDGEINWEKTINETFSLLANNRPYYPELVTTRKVNDDFHFLKRLHEIVLTECSNCLKEANLLKLFDFTEIQLSDDERDDIADTDYILHVIEQYLAIEFNTRKQLLLKALYVYISKQGMKSEVDDISFIGTNAFHVVWEKACAEVLGNSLQQSLVSLRLSEFDSTKLIDLIEKPKWTKGTLQHNSSDTLIPDTISVYGNSFLIFDAKYYTLTIGENRIKNYPGIGDITKQFLYQLAYRDLILQNNLNTKNYFVMPTQGEENLDYATVSMDMFGQLSLSDIHILKLNAENVYSHYLSNSINKTLLDALTL